MHQLVAGHGQPGWVAALTPLTANVAVAEQTATGRVIAAWPSFALIGSYELLMRQIRSTAPLSALYSIELAEAGSCNCRRGSGPWLTGQVTARFPPARPSPVST